VWRVSRTAPRIRPSAHLLICPSLPDWRSAIRAGTFSRYVFTAYQSR
jgi:hypothetical protein